MAKGVCMKDLCLALGLIFFLGLVLVFLRSPVSEGFYSGGSSMNACGVDMPCGGDLKCINGFCAKTDKVVVEEKEPVDMLEPGASVPYY
jgi:hypothetical protein